MTITTLFGPEEITRRPRTIKLSSYHSNSSAS